MGPGRSRFWCPSFRLGAFVVASAVALNLFLQLFRPDTAAAASGGVEDGTVERRKRRQEKRRRTIETFLRGPWQGALLQEPVAVVMAADLPGELRIASPSVEVLPQRLQMVEFPSTWPILADELRAWNPPSPNLEAILALPDRLVEAAAAGLGQVRSGDGGILDRLMDVGAEKQGGSLIGEYLHRLAEREQRYFASWEESTVADTQDVDDFLDDQRKLLWDTLRRTYSARYRIRADETLKEAAFDVDRWRGIDLLVVPPLIVGYAMYRGVDRRFSIAGTRLRVAIEPYSEWRDDAVPAGLGLEWAPEGWPVSLIATAGLEGGDFQMDFIGIGTSIGMVRRALTLAQPEQYRDR